MTTTHNVCADRVEPLVSPRELLAELPLPDMSARFVARARKEIEDVLQGVDPRPLVVVGPCSIHDPSAALEYAERLGALRTRLAGDLVVCMRAYFEKPRSTVGWKGLINDPHLDGSCDVPEGLRRARRMLVELASRRIPAATETLDPIAAQYLADGVAWTAIGARTAESQTHRELAAGLGVPVGFKNGTQGELDVAIQAMQAARAAHTYLRVDAEGQAAVARTRGNRHTHLVLRGGAQGPNYESAHVGHAAERLKKVDLNPRVLIDCSHANSQKNHQNQARVLMNVVEQMEDGSPHVLGVMLESHLVAGRQDLEPNRVLIRGQSITDACLDFATTEKLLERFALVARRSRRQRAMARPSAYREYAVNPPSHCRQTDLRLRRAR